MLMKELFSSTSFDTSGLVMLFNAMKLEKRLSIRGALMNSSLSPKN
jgi:hypothetical protein